MVLVIGLCKNKIHTYFDRINQYIVIKINIGLKNCGRFSINLSSVCIT